MHDGIPAKDVYHHAVSYVQKHKPELVKHIPKNIGFGVSSSFTPYKHPHLRVPDGLRVSGSRLFIEFQERAHTENRYDL